MLSDCHWAWSSRKPSRKRSPDGGDCNSVCVRGEAFALGWLCAQHRAEQCKKEDTCKEGFCARSSRVQRAMQRMLCVVHAAMRIRGVSNAEDISLMSQLVSDMWQLRKGEYIYVITREIELHSLTTRNFFLLQLIFLLSRKSTIKGSGLLRFLHFSSAFQD